MKKNIILLFFGATLVSGCGSHYFSIATKNSSASDYRILEASDSNLRIIPWEYRNELTPEVLREYSRLIPFDSLTQLTKIPTFTSDLGYTFAGMTAGAFIGGAIGYVSYTPPDCRNTFLCIDFGPGFAALVLATLGLIPGGIIGILVRPGDKNMLPVREHLNEIRK